METFAHTEQKSRLGQILVSKKLISNEQLSQAMTRQANTGERLGDILTQWNVVTQRHIESALKTQRRLRLVASLVTATMTPMITACGGGGGGGMNPFKPPPKSVPPNVLPPRRKAQRLLPQLRPPPPDKAQPPVILHPQSIRLKPARPVRHPATCGRSYRITCAAAPVQGPPANLLLWLQPLP
ncbi:MAG: hypothetical protein IPN06_09185 [Burkholderiales bacterium]|nr:hypothetical protein [Burkholderiales bacterium]